MNYLYSKLEYDLESSPFERNTPQREAFWQHMQKVIKALHDIEWVDSCDMSPGDENEAVDACLNSSAFLQGVIAERDVLRQCLDPRQWTNEMSVAWHLAIPDTHAAFKSLIEAAKKADPVTPPPA
ncbi:hypothetical protein [Tautonia plasticadhaerens]|nr:hypothetical protein [Tautonia plasticadhaerens]